MYIKIIGKKGSLTGSVPCFSDVVVTTSYTTHTSNLITRAEKSQQITTQITTSVQTNNH